eukprot:scaffold21979_cov66-Phaeocystis_antarctica.AAC.2
MGGKSSATARGGGVMMRESGSSSRQAVAQNCSISNHVPRPLRSTAVARRRGGFLLLPRCAPRSSTIGPLTRRTSASEGGSTVVVGVVQYIGSPARAPAWSEFVDRIESTRRA